MGRCYPSHEVVLLQCGVAFRVVSSSTESDNLKVIRLQLVEASCFAPLPALSQPASEIPISNTLQTHTHSQSHSISTMEAATSHLTAVNLPVLESENPALSSDNSASVHASAAINIQPKSLSMKIYPDTPELYVRISIVESTSTLPGQAQDTQAQQQSQTDIQGGDSNTTEKYVACCRAVDFGSIVYDCSDTCTLSCVAFVIPSRHPNDLIGIGIPSFELLQIIKFQCHKMSKIEIAIIRTMMLLQFEPTPSPQPSYPPSCISSCNLHIFCKVSSQLNYNKIITTLSHLFCAL